jgi:hypothetical protein
MFQLPDWKWIKCLCHVQLHSTWPRPALQSAVFLHHDIVSPATTHADKHSHYITTVVLSLIHSMYFRLPESVCTLLKTHLHALCFLWGYFIYLLLEFYNFLKPTCFMQKRIPVWWFYESKMITNIMTLMCWTLTISADKNACFKFVLIDTRSWSRHVIMAIPAVRFRTMWCAAARMRDSSESKAKSFLTICSHVVSAILMDLSTTGWIHSCTARSTAGRMNCLRWGWAWNRATCEKN